MPIISEFRSNNNPDLLAQKVTFFLQKLKKNWSNCSIPQKYAFLTILLLAVTLPTSLMAISQSAENRSRANFNTNNFLQTSSDSEKNRIVVCPENYQGNAKCQYFGASGLQAAINAAPYGTASNRTVIRLVSGPYIPRSSQIIITSQGTKRRFYFDTRNKNLIIRGDDPKSVIIEGTSSSPAAGFSILNGVVNLERLTLRKIYLEPSCENADSPGPCSGGSGITADNNSKVNLKGIIIDSIATFGVGARKDSKVKVTSSIFKNINNSRLANAGSIVAFGETDHLVTVDILNSTFYRNFTSDIMILTLPDAIVKSTITNNIFSWTQKAADGTGGSSIRTNYYSQGKFTISSSYNLFYGYTGECNYCTNHSINKQHPQFVSLTDFHLLSNSPAINHGVPFIKDPDGTISDMGGYGGTGACSLDKMLQGCDKNISPTPSITPQITNEPSSTPLPTETPSLTPPPFNSPTPTPLPVSVSDDFNTPPLNSSIWTSKISSYWSNWTIVSNQLRLQKPPGALSLKNTFAQGDFEAIVDFVNFSAKNNNRRMTLRVENQNTQKYLSIQYYGNGLLKIYAHGADGKFLSSQNIYLSNTPPIRIRLVRKGTKLTGYYDLLDGQGDHLIPSSTPNNFDNVITDPGDVSLEGSGIDGDIFTFDNFSLANK